MMGIIWNTGKLERTEIMTAREWKNLPELIRRCEVVAVGIKRDLLPEVTVVVASPEDIDAVPYGKVAAIRLGKQLRFVKVTVSRMLAREFRN